MQHGDLLEDLLTPIKLTLPLPDLLIAVLLQEKVKMGQPISLHIPVALTLQRLLISKENMHLKEHGLLIQLMHI